jgi:hypothetical protein
MPLHNCTHCDVARGARAMSAGSLGWEEAIQEIRAFSAAGGGLLLPAPSTEIAAPQDAKLSARAPRAL